jgi:hypothetical protein
MHHLKSVCASTVPMVIFWESTLGPATPGNSGPRATEETLGWVGASLQCSAPPQGEVWPPYTPHTSPGYHQVQVVAPRRQEEVVTTRGRVSVPGRCHPVLGDRDWPLVLL